MLSIKYFKELPTDPDAPVNVDELRHQTLALTDELEIHQRSY